MKNLRSGFIAATLLLIVSAVSCTGSNDDEKSIWLYEQAQQGNPDFQFYPEMIKTTGMITVADSIRILRQAFTKPIDSLIVENDRYLKGLLQMQTICVKYDMEQQREELIRDIAPLENVNEWLLRIREQLHRYDSLPAGKILVRKVECRFSYSVLPGRKTVRHKLYLISQTSGKVVSAQDK
jgi:hypothetical protein